MVQRLLKCPPLVNDSRLSWRSISTVRKESLFYDHRLPILSAFSVRIVIRWLRGHGLGEVTAVVRITYQPWEENGRT